VSRADEARFLDIVLSAAAVRSVLDRVGGLGLQD